MVQFFEICNDKFNKYHVVTKQEDGKFYYWNRYRSRWRQWRFDSEKEFNDWIKENSYREICSSEAVLMEEFDFYFQAGA